MKSVFKILKILLILTLCAVVAAAVCFFCRGADSQMRNMTDFALRRVSVYNFQGIANPDPVEKALKETFGEDKPISREILYSYLKQNAAELKWEVQSTSEERKQAVVLITYIDGEGFVKAYASKLAGVIADRIFSGNMSVADAEKILDQLTDSENAALLTTAVAEADREAVKETEVVVQFDRKICVYIPESASAELANAVTSGLYEYLNNIEDLIAGSVVNVLLDRVFDLLTEFDISKIEELTGSDLSVLRGLSADSELGKAVLEFLKDCATSITYVIDEYDLDACYVAVTCNYPDASGIISAYLGKLVKHSLTNLLTEESITDDWSAELFRETVQEQGTLPRLKNSVKLSLNSDTGNFDFSDTVFNIATANLYSRLSDLAGMLA